VCSSDLIDLGKNRLKILMELIERAPEEIEDELKTTANDWLACLGGMLDGIRVMMSNVENVNKSLIDDVGWKSAEAKLQFLIKKRYEQIQKKEKPSEEQKKEYLSLINNIFKEE
jgi:hypothetical protein